MGAREWANVAHFKFNYIFAAPRQLMLDRIWLRRDSREGQKLTHKSQRFE